MEIADGLWNFITIIVVIEIVVKSTMEDKSCSFNFSTNSFVMGKIDFSSTIAITSFIIVVDWLMEEEEVSKMD